MLVNMNMPEQQEQQQHNPEHTTLDIENNNTLNRELENIINPTDENDNIDLSDVEDIDAIDGRIPRVPKAIPEADDEDEYDDRPNFNDPHIGVDDGLLPDAENGINGNHHPSNNGFDMNAYQQKKTLAQGMMDLALLSANANQLRYVLESNGLHPYYCTSLVLISLSIICQITVGVGLILNSRYDVQKGKEICRANTINNYTVIGIFIVTVVNVFISAFGVAEPASEKNYLQYSKSLS